jgi:hypothetical protein
VNVTCLPLYSILMAFNNPIIDYFSLDVEGSELAILKTIPFDKVDIRVSIKSRSHSYDFLNLQLQPQRCSRLERFSKKKKYCCFQTS